MINKLKKLKLDLLLKELKLIDSEKEYVDQFTDYYKPIFISEAIENGYNPNNNDKKNETEINTQEQKKSIEVNEEELKTIKSIFRSIAKICHPDKTKNIYRNKLYEEAQFAYENNDLLTLYKITTKLSIEVEIDFSSILLLEKIIDYKKKDLCSFETSFLWLWANENNTDKKLSIIKQFINQHGI